MTLWKATTPTTHIRTAGRIQDNPWCGAPRLVTHAASAVKDGRSLILGRNALPELSILPGRISIPQHYW